MFNYMNCFNRFRHIKKEPSPLQKELLEIVKIYWYYKDQLDVFEESTIKLVKTPWDSKDLYIKYNQDWYQLNCGYLCKHPKEKPPYDRCVIHLSTMTDITTLRLSIDENHKLLIENNLQLTPQEIKNLLSYIKSQLLSLEIILDVQKDINCEKQEDKETLKENKTKQYEQRVAGYQLEVLYH